MMPQDHIYDEIITSLKRVKQGNRPLLVGINGVDGSGKTSLTQHLADRLASDARVVHIDDFHHPREIRYANGELSPKSYYRDSFNIEAFAQQTLAPIKRSERLPVRVTSKLLDLKTNQADHKSIEIQQNHIVLCEGVFLFRPELVAYFDVKIFVDCDFETTLSRMIKRDGIDPLCPVEARRITERFNQKYKPAQEQYLQLMRPKDQADIVIDNRDFTAPKLITAQRKNFLQQ